MLWALMCMVHLTACSYHVTYAFQSESTLYGCLNSKELLAWSRPKIWSLKDFDRTQTHNHLVCKGTLIHLTKLAKWLSCVVSTYLYGVFDYMFLWCHANISEWILTKSQAKRRAHFIQRCTLKGNCSKSLMVLVKL